MTEEIQELQRQDIEAVEGLQPEGWPNILPFILFYLNDPYCFPIKVMRDDVIAGIGCGIVHNEAGWAAHIIVHPNFRKQGIGRLITQTLVAQLQCKGCKSIHLIATDLGAPVYEKIGFETNTNYLFFKNIIFEKCLLISKRVIPYDPTFRDHLAQLDMETSGEDRFFHLEPHLAGGFIYVKDHVAEGFYLPGFGEGLITASTPNAGIELMKLRFREIDHAVLPVENLSGIEFLHQNNFREFRMAKRMSYGIKRNWKPQNIYNRIGGNLG